MTLTADTLIRQIINNTLTGRVQCGDGYRYRTHGGLGQDVDDLIYQLETDGMVVLNADGTVTPTAEARTVTGLARPGGRKHRKKPPQVTFQPARTAAA